MSRVSEFLRRWSARGSSLPKSRRVRRAFEVEPLESRIMPAVTATFSPGAGVLSVFGDALDNTITLSRNAAGQILVNGGAVAITALGNS